MSPRKYLTALVALLFATGASPVQIDAPFEELLPQAAEQQCASGHIRIYKYDPKQPLAADVATVDKETCLANYTLESETTRLFFEQTHERHIDRCIHHCELQNKTDCATTCNPSHLPLKKRRFFEVTTWMTAACRGMIHDLLGGPVKAGICTQWKFRPSDRLERLITQADLPLNNHAGDNCISEKRKNEFARIAAEITPLGTPSAAARETWTELGASCHFQEAFRNRGERTVCRFSYSSWHVRGSSGGPVGNSISISLIENRNGTISDICASAMGVGL